MFDIKILYTRLTHERYRKRQADIDIFHHKEQENKSCKVELENHENDSQGWIF